MSVKGLVVDKIDADELMKNLRFEFNDNFILYLKENWRVNFRIY